MRIKIDALKIMNVLTFSFRQRSVLRLGIQSMAKQLSRGQKEKNKIRKCCNVPFSVAQRQRMRSQKTFNVNDYERDRVDE